MIASSGHTQFNWQADQAEYTAALDKAHVRACHSYFTQYVLIDTAGHYIAVDEGDYGALPGTLADRVIDAVPGQLSDEI
ncbi:hypothetical protein [Novosphingobium percolationis]|uniref:hypothetical protein n=1 Tax=Novosphingobium percolationis TaxID=2871811 RepID=UPI001CD3C736|nr:hypothetical protein [Novosphingobium percolationis]